jgi:hypothetical protein
MKAGQFQNMINEIKKVPSHQLNAQEIENFSTMVLEFLKICHTDSIQQVHREILQE